MAIVEVKVPQLSESVAEATLLQWKKKAGDSVTMDEILVEIETDKVVLEVPAPASGVLSELVIADGGTVMAEQLIAKIDTEAKGIVAPTKGVASTPVVASTQTNSVVASPVGGVAMPSAAKILAEKSISADQVIGTGKDGRVTKGDALAATAAKTVAQVAPAPVVRIPAGTRPEERVPMSRLRSSPISNST